MFQTFFIEPIFNLLILLYKYVAFEDLGLAIIALTILIRFALYPLFYKGMRTQSIMQKLQPEIKKVQKENKDDREAQALALMAVYKKNNVNPFSSFLYLFIQLPILLAMYQVFRGDITSQLTTSLYAFISAPSTVHATLFNLVDLTKASIIVVALAVIAQYIQGRLTLGAAKKEAKGIAQYMVFLGPAITLLILPQLSAAVGIYWVTNSVFSIFQQQRINKSINQKEK